ncbi:DNA-directed RNA polymerase subunit omega [Nitrospira sp. CMX1]|nr:DNA-directed RNA polymerase subunit omega [Nitrospira sp.]MBS0165269.1 DNA-directed RNA polymerase subunit omega [Nitrospira sp.]
MIDMLNLLPQYTSNEFDSRHRLVIVASQRAKHLTQGARPSGPSRFTRETTVALDEVLKGQVKYLIGKEARDAMKEAKRGKEGETERIAMMTGEDAREIKKELSVYVDDTTQPTAAPTEE